MRLLVVCYNNINKKEKFTMCTSVLECRPIPGMAGAYNMPGSEARIT